MKKAIILMFITLLAMMPSSWSFAGTESVTSAVVSFFDAMSRGDTEYLNEHVGGELYESIKNLINNNADYPQLLRDKYDGVQVYLLSYPQITEQHSVARVKILFSDGVISIKDIFLAKDDTGLWQIVDSGTAQQ